MPDILHDVPIAAAVDRVYAAISTPGGLDSWWTLTSRGEPIVGSAFDLGFGLDYQWRADVRAAVPSRCIAFEFTHSTSDWMGTCVRLDLEPTGNAMTIVHFTHTWWATATEHFRVSSFCWAMYLRLLKRFVEHGEVVPYPSRLDV